MARYTNYLVTVLPTTSLQRSLATVLETCGLNLIYQAPDYLVAKEKPGNVSYTKLATVEVMISASPEARTKSTVNLVVKNEELPLKSNNHCQQIFEQVNEALMVVSH